MKKQILSFDEFVFEAYQIIQEAEGGSSFDDVKQKLSELLGNIGNTALLRVEQLFSANSNTKSGLLGFAGDQFNSLITKYDGKKRKIDSINVDVQNFKYGNVIQGNVFLGKFSPNAGDLPSGYSLPVKDKKTKLSDLLGSVNCANIHRKNVNVPFTVQKDGKVELKPETEGDRKGIYKGSGIDKQFVLTGLGADGFEFNLSQGKEALGLYVETGDKVKNDPDTVSKKVKKASKSSLTCTMVLYTIKQIVPGGGNPITIEKIDKVVTIIKGGDDELDVNIADNGTLFDLNKSVLKEDGKLNITNAISNQFTSVSKIEVIGGASKEGPAERNKTLCLERAKAVAEYLKTVCKEAEITASNETNIQPETSTDDLKTWRKVTLKITGSKIDKKPDVEKVEYVARVKNLKADRADLAQITLSFVIEVDEA